MGISLPRSHFTSPHTVIIVRTCCGGLSGRDMCVKVSDKCSFSAVSPRPAAQPTASNAGRRAPPQVP